MDPAKRGSSQEEEVWRETGPVSGSLQCPVAELEPRLVLAHGVQALTLEQ